MPKICSILGLVLTLVTLAGAQVRDEQCLKCHADTPLRRTAPGRQSDSLYVDRLQYRSSVHGSLGCASCHRDLERTREFPHATKLQPVNCARCHEAEEREISSSSHRQLTAPEEAKTMTCSACHGRHDIRPQNDPQSHVNRQNVTGLCLACHKNQVINSSTNVTVNAYEHSVHGQKVQAQGDSTAAECVDCHGNHLILPAKNTASSTFKSNIPQTCGRCHQSVLTEYKSSIHGQAIIRGILEAPVCTDCHGEHTIEAPQTATSQVSQANVPKTCGRCHENVQLTAKYGIASERFSTYEDSYHGVANQFGKTVVANCASCHGFHHILPASDPESTIHPSNLARTCGQCHPNASENFARGKMHVKATLQNSPGVFAVRQFYYIFIGFLMVAFIAYIIIEYTGFIRRRKGKEGT